MIAWLSEKLARVFVTSGAVTEEDKEIYVYGLDVLISTAMGLLFVLALGIAIGRLPETALYLVFFVALRSTAGGYHAGTHLMCLMITTLSFAAGAAPWLLLPEQTCRMLALPAGAVAVALLFWLSPAPHENRPATPAELKRFRSLSIALACAESAIVVLFFLLRLSSFAYFGSVGMFSFSLSLCAAHLANKCNKRKQYTILS